VAVLAEVVAQRPAALLHRGWGIANRFRVASSGSCNFHSNTSGLSAPRLQTVSMRQPPGSLICRRGLDQSPVVGPGPGRLDALSAASSALFTPSVDPAAGASGQSVICTIAIRCRRIPTCQAPEIVRVSLLGVFGRRGPANFSISAPPVRTRQVGGMYTPYKVEFGRQDLRLGA
jgi:hypothetical protein